MGMGYFDDPYESVRGKKGDPCNEHDGRWPHPFEPEWKSRPERQGKNGSKPVAADAPTVDLSLTTTEPAPVQLTRFGRHGRRRGAD